MAQYIAKAPVIAEIEKRKKRNVLNEGAFEEDIDILSFLDTLEVKEVDLEKEIDFYIESSLTGTNPIYTKGGVSCIIEKTAKHFFELGLKAQKGE